MDILRDYQQCALHQMHDGCILRGGVGSGKSRTGLAYYYTSCGGSLDTIKELPIATYRNLYIITTPKKRDTGEWIEELKPFKIDPQYVVIDSWNNIEKYKDLQSQFFIFDEQRAIGKGKWSKMFIRIAKHNRWIMLSATPGDNWNDYVPVFIANGFYSNRTEFEREHAVFSKFTKYPHIERYINTGRLIRYRNLILVHMDFKREVEKHKELLTVPYDILTTKLIRDKRWDPYENKPIETAVRSCFLQRRVANMDPSRCNAILELCKKHERMIIFYNNDYELLLLRNMNLPEGWAMSEWNGHKHDILPDTDNWIYLVQYTAGCEGWNCITCDTIIFYSLNYSYKIMEQASGRINRMNTPYKDLYYYYILSHAPIDLAIAAAIKRKKKFNETKYFEGGKN